MDKKMICESLYASQSDVVVRRKKSYILPALILLLGIVLVVANYTLEVENLSSDVSSALLLAAGATLLVGALMLISRIFDREGEPWHLPTNKPLKYEERFFPLEEREKICGLIDAGSYLKLVATDTGALSGIGVAVYRTQDLSLVAMQAYEYLDYEYRPITEVRCVVRKGEA